VSGLETLVGIHGWTWLFERRSRAVDAQGPELHGGGQGI
jgi:hypothetical protein